MKLCILLSSAFLVCSTACTPTSKSAQTADNLKSQPSPTAVNEPSAQDEGTCKLTLAAVPAVEGVKLGMTSEEMVSVFPGSKDDPEVRTVLQRPPSKLGVSELLIRPAKYAKTTAKPEDGLATQIVATLLDGRVSTLTVNYNGPEWPNVDSFVQKFVEKTNLPALDQWSAYSGLDNQLKILTCKEFEVRLFAGGEKGNANYISLRDLEADKKLKERRKKAREQASPTPGNQ